MDKKMVAGVKRMLNVVVTSHDKKMAKEVYKKGGNKAETVAIIRRKAGLRDTPEVNQAVKEFLS